MAQRSYERRDVKEGQSDLALLQEIDPGAFQVMTCSSVGWSSAPKRSATERRPSVLLHHGSEFRSFSGDDNHLSFIEKLRAEQARLSRLT